VDAFNRLNYLNLRTFSFSFISLYFIISIYIFNLNLLILYLISKLCQKFRPRSNQTVCNTKSFVGDCSWLYIIDLVYGHDGRSVEPACGLTLFGFSSGFYHGLLTKFIANYYKTWLFYQQGSNYKLSFVL
jgi:hypothetical protein